MYVEVAQRLLPLGEGVRDGAVLPTRGAELAEYTRGLERDGGVLRVVRVIVLWVVLVGVAVDRDGGLGE